MFGKGKQFEKYRNINYRASLLFFKNRSVQNPVRGKPRVTIWSHIYIKIIWKSLKYFNLERLAIKDL